MLASLVIMNTQNHSEIPLTPTSIIFFLNKNEINVGENVEKLELSIVFGRTVQFCSHCGKQYGDSSKSSTRN